MNKTNTKKGFVIPLVIAIAVVFAAGGIYYISRNHADIPTPINMDEKYSQNIPQSTNSDWKLYENNSVGFYIMYPPSWKVNEYKNEKTGLFSRIGFNDGTKIQDIWSVSLFYPPKWTEEKFIEDITKMLGNNIQKKEVATDLGASGATKMIIVIDGKSTEYLIGNDGSKVYNITGPSSPEFTSFYQSFRLVQ